MACLDCEGGVFEHILKKKKVEEHGDEESSDADDSEDSDESSQEDDEGQMTSTSSNSITSSIVIAPTTTDDETLEDMEEDTIAENVAENDDWNGMVRMLESNAIENLVDEIIEDRGGPSGNFSETDEKIAEIDRKAKEAKNTGIGFLYPDSDSDIEISFKKK